MPGNLLETGGLNGCAKWAHENNLNVLINRPLNAIEDDHLYRLAAYDQPEGYEEIYNEVYQIISETGNNEAALFLEELHENRNMLQSVSHYQFILQGEMIPFFRRLLVKLKEDDSELINRFIDIYGKEVMYHISLKTASFLKNRGIHFEKPVQMTALKFLVENPQVTCVLLGMRKRSYVDDAFSVLNKKVYTQT